MQYTDIKHTFILDTINRLTVLIQLNIAFVSPKIGLRSPIKDTWWKQELPSLQTLLSGNCNLIEETCVQVSSQSIEPISGYPDCMFLQVLLAFYYLATNTRTQEVQGFLLLFL